jgi:hypothetical protein
VLPVSGFGPFGFPGAPGKTQDAQKHRIRQQLVGQIEFIENKGLNFHPGAILD